MWTRADLKKDAKAFLSKFYLKAFLVSFIILLVGGTTLNNNNGFNFEFNSNQNFQTRTYFQTDELSPFQQAREDFNIHVKAPLGMTMFRVAVGLALLIAFGFILFRIFVGYAVEVGGRRFFVKGAQNDEEAKLDYMTSAFESGSYGNVISTMFVRAIYIFLFYLLLIIPGIVKSYSYMMVPYILSDNPNMDRNKVLQLSKEMTDGHKWDMFVLDLSFIGWYILGSLALGIGTLFVNPYVDATKAQLYLTFRKNALQTKMCTASDLNLSIDNEVEATDEDWFNYEY